jgi:hypothetical protein
MGGYILSGWKDGSNAHENSCDNRKHHCSLRCSCEITATGFISSTYNGIIYFLSLKENYKGLVFKIA